MEIPMSGTTVIEVAGKLGHTIALTEGPCHSIDHAGRFCRVRWFTCSCFDERRLEMLAKRHDVDDPNAIEWASSSAMDHLRGAIEWDKH